MEKPWKAVKLGTLIRNLAAQSSEHPRASEAKVAPGRFALNIQIWGIIGYIYIGIYHAVLPSNLLHL